MPTWITLPSRRLPSNIIGRFKGTLDKFVVPALRQAQAELACAQAAIQVIDLNGLPLSRE